MSVRPPHRFSLSSVTTFTVSILWGCSPDDPDPYRDVIALEAATVDEIEAGAAEDASFETAETLDAVEYGLIGDGVTDNTATFDSLLANGNRTIHLRAGTYVTGKLTIPSNTILLLEPGVTILDSGRLSDTDSLVNIRGENVRIEGLGARILSYRGTYDSGEHRHGVSIAGARQVTIIGIESSGHEGDGFYITGAPGRPSTDLLLKGCRAEGNKRQGISIISAERLRVIDCQFTNTYGTAPQFGVDLEPDHPLQILSNIVLLRPQTRANEGGGIWINLSKLDASSPPVEISIVGHNSEREYPPLATDVPPNVNATLRYGIE